MEKLSEKYFREWKDYEKEVIPFKFTSEVKSFVGKKLKNFYHANWYSGNCDILVFDDDAALWIDEKGHYVSCIGLVQCWWREKSNYKEAHALSYCTDECCALQSLGLVTQEQVNKALELAERFRTQQHKEDVKQEIQRKLNEISNLKEEL